jgi:hypothetical protein
MQICGAEISIPPLAESFVHSTGICTAEEIDELCAPLLCSESSYKLLHFNEGRLILGPLENLGNSCQSKIALIYNLMRCLVAICMSALDQT